jgi:hypothetical protein
VLDAGAPAAATLYLKKLSASSTAILGTWVEDGYCNKPHVRVALECGQAFYLIAWLKSVPPRCRFETVLPI